MELPMFRQVVVIGCVLLIVMHHCDADEPAAHFPKGAMLPSQKLDGGSIQGEALMRVKPSTVALGESFNLECEIRCTGGAGDVWNGFLSEDVVLPAQVIIASADGKVRHELLQRHQ
jgi:hypothetical protein